MHLKGISNISKSSEKEEKIIKNFENKEKKNIIKEKKDIFDLKNKTVGQIKNVTQEKKPEQNIQKKENPLQGKIINSFQDLIDICSDKKEIKLKYELEKNVNLVSFENQRIEISFNEFLDKEFIKILSSKLYEWTGNRWIISISKKKGELSKKDKEAEIKKNYIKDAKKEKIYKTVIDKFSDAELIDIEVTEDSYD